jgi:hypothetical protein
MFDVAGPRVDADADKFKQEKRFSHRTTGTVRSLANDELALLTAEAADGRR